MKHTTEVGIFERSVEFYNFWEIFGSILVEFSGFRAIPMVLAVWARFFKLECYRNHPKIWSGGRLLNILGGDNNCSWEAKGRGNGGVL